MKNVESVGWGELVAQSVGVFCVVTCLLAFFPGWEFVGKIFAEKDAPAWVQAIGSIAAILVAVGVASWQSRETAAKEERAEAQKIASEREFAAYLLNTFCGTLFAVVSKFKTTQIIYAWDLRLMSVLLSEELSNVKNMPVLAISAESRRAFFGFKLIAIQFIEAIEFAERSASHIQGQGMVVEETAKSVLQSLIVDKHPQLDLLHEILKSDKHKDGHI